MSEIRRAQETVTDLIQQWFALIEHDYGHGHGGDVCNGIVEG
jgi:hypothetical protein